MIGHPTKTFFSISFDFVITQTSIPYDLYINSSGIKDKEKFIRVFPLGGVLTTDDVATFKKKYYQLYILESQRDFYLKSLIDCENVSSQEKTEVIKDSAIIYLNNIFDESKEFTTELLGEAISGCRDSVESMIDVINDYDVKKVQELIGSLSFHDFYTYDHSINVSMYCISIFKALRPSATREEVTMAGLGGLLHDLGKIKIPTNIINNPGKLTDEEFDEIKKHPAYGKELLEENESCYEMAGVDFNVIKRIIYEHHENYNGTGYPKKIGGTDIHVLARITAIADFFDAITTKRSYHNVMPISEALQLMEKTVGKKIDPKIFEVFKNNINQFTEPAAKLNQILPEDFDPCSPHDELPLMEYTNKPNYQAEDIFAETEQKKFGKIKSDFNSLKDDDNANPEKGIKKKAS
ncbi:MAG: HD domain-containing protein [Bacteriovoracaceae bacterium]|jgi:HD-GYP domain-containing protein (c-di-GMP phosphodiesterase class II)|nr:HD domain-containing protein [Bacteriovoracaceae bacterium]